MLVSAVRYFKGYVNFSARGKFPERFLNLTSRNGINLWNAVPCSGGLNATMSVYDYKKIRKIAKKSKVVTKISSKHGLPFITQKYKPRIGLLIGACIGIIILLVLSNFVWSISISGVNRISDTYLLEVLQKNGVSVGVYKNNLDVGKIERNISLEIDDIGWMSVNIIGNTVSVEVKEKALKPTLTPNSTPCNIKAKSDGVITKIKASKGITQVLKGSGVTKGDLLVSGIMETKMDTIEYVHANAEVYADVNSKNELNIPCEYQYYSINENKALRNRVHLLWLEFPSSFSFEIFDNCISDYHTSNVFINDTSLPLGLKTETTYELQIQSVKPNKQNVQKIFDNSALIFEVFEKPESTVKSREMKIKKNNGSYVCTTEYVFNENIAEAVEFSVTE